MIRLSGGGLLGGSLGRGCKNGVEVAVRVRRVVYIVRLGSW